MLIFIIVLCVLAGILEALSYIYAMKGISYSSRPLTTPAEPNETFYIESTITNGTYLPKTYVRLSETIPYALVDTGDGMLESGKEHETSENTNVTMVLSNAGFSSKITIQRMTYDARLSSTLYMLPRQIIVRRLPVQFTRRGRFFLKGAYISCGDLLGFFSKTESFAVDEEIVIMPKRCENNAVLSTLGGFLGDVSVRRFIFEDPVLTIGIHEYTGTEPMKSIAWKQSARSDDIFVKKCDYTLEPTAAVILNVDHPTDISPTEIETELEYCFSIARVVCEALNAKGIKFSFMTNALAAGAEQIWPTARDGLGTAHLMAIFEGLGRSTYFPSKSFTELLDSATKKVEQGRSYILITPYVTPVHRQGISRLRLLSGLDVLIIVSSELDKEESAG